ncbi:hypothetical protein D187_007492 [Cystobacter fuscus DSM 2262]|uniref:Uncharacterized protein n=1 Tax=Cystobacter fuscus (strain ATCC 25194 / DSM 2262 / NBRC 100088 / M29) TaxID=1242864 RepID=S9NVG3_CYSF2|nr:hypothetical protein [Cystobacter fuscus]EPX56150.1 hypothetical protein D187_007492 [Cystobacter fuscus DSM 2262]
MACFARPAPSRPSARASPRPALAAVPNPPAQQPFAFLAEVPQREVRRRERAHRPHLRGRTPPPAEPGAQLVLPFQRPSRGRGLLSAELAEAMEGALRDARGQPEGSRRQRAAEEKLLGLLSPFLESEARRAWASHERTYLSRADLLQEAALRAQKLWRGFTPGKAGPGRTLYPAYVAQAVRQHLGNVLAEGRLVGPTHWGRKLAARARKRVEREEVTYEEALHTEGADAATALALAQGATRCEEREASDVADAGGERLEELATQGAAVVALEHLPRRQRLAVGVPLGLCTPRLNDAQLARHLGCTLAELHEARAQGLAALREHLEAA